MTTFGDTVRIESINRQINRRRLDTVVQTAGTGTQVEIHIGARARRDDVRWAATQLRKAVRQAGRESTVVRVGRTRAWTILTT